MIFVVIPALTPWVFIFAEDTATENRRSDRRPQRWHQTARVVGSPVRRAAGECVHWSTRKWFENIGY